jgi:hypothetical protein
MMEWMKRNSLMVLVLAALCAACGKMTSVNSPREKEDISLVEIAHYDADSKIRYGVTNDNTHVYLRFDTDNMATIMRVRKLGAIVRFDTNGKRKGTHALKYPIYTGDDDQTVGGDQGPLPMGMRLDDLFPPTTTAVWIVGEQVKDIDLGLNVEGFVCKAGLDDKGVLMYHVGVPFSLLGGKGPEDFPGLTMELEIPSPDAGTKTSGSNPDPGSSMPGSMNTGIPGGNPNSMNGPMPTGGMMSSGGVSGGVPDISIWMEVKLSPSAAQ